MPRAPVSIEYGHRIRRFADKKFIRSIWFSHTFENGKNLSRRYWLGAYLSSKRNWENKNKQKKLNE